MIPSSRLLIRQIYKQTVSVNSSYSVQTVKLPKQHEWNRAVASAEKMVGFPTSIFNMQSLMNDDVTGMTDHMRKLMGSDHPVLKSMKRLVIHGGQNNMQVRGLMMLLMSKALNSTCTTQFLEANDYEPNTGVLMTQRKLAEIVEMISAAYSIHKSVLNLPYDLTNENADAKEDLQQLEYGNKIAILGGDYLLANACVGLADLRNTYIVEMVAIAIGEFTQSEFHGKRDVQGRLIPDQDSIDCKSWIDRNKMASGSLLASGFKGIGMLSQLPDEVTERSERIGRNLAVALQAFIELQPFIEENHFDSDLSLGSAPVLFHLQNDSKLLDYIGTCEGDIDNLDLKKIYSTVTKDGSGIQIAKDLCKNHAAEVLKDLQEIPDGEAKIALIRIVNYILNK